MGAPAVRGPTASRRSTPIALAHAVLEPGTPGLARVDRALRRRRLAGRTGDSIAPPSRASCSRTPRRAPTSRPSSILPSTTRSRSGSRTLPAATAVAVADIPLLFETGRDGEFDEVVVTACAAGRAGSPAEGAGRPRRGGRAGTARGAVADRREGARGPARSSTRAARTRRPTRRCDALVARWSA